MEQKNVKPLRVLCICGTGMAGATVVLQTMKKIFKDMDIPVVLETGASIQLSSLFGGQKVDMIVHTSILPKKYDIPCFHALAFLTGIKEKELIESIKASAAEIWAKRLEES